MMPVLLLFLLKVVFGYFFFVATNPTFPTNTAAILNTLCRHGRLRLLNFCAPPIAPLTMAIRSVRAIRSGNSEESCFPEPLKGAAADFSGGGQFLLSGTMYLHQCVTGGADTGSRMQRNQCF